MARTTVLTVVGVAGALLGLSLLAEPASAYDFYGMVLPDIGIQDLIDYFTALIENPNIYADFDLASFRAFMTENYLGQYFTLAMLGIYFLAILMMMFGLRRARKAGE